MAEDIGRYAPPSDELLEILGMRLYDVMNQLVSQMMKTGKDEDYIEFKAHNGISGDFYLLNVTVKKV
ncbi:MAG: hypothetical protein IKE95_06660 [Methanobrevibacter sp.]|nr:hypothetical protein [Methanobrevibacter sp.]